jgi:probable addiction module antidote protein
MRRNLDYRADLLADLRDDPRFAAEYVSAAYVDSQEAFLVALRDVSEAQKGIAKVAVGAKLNRENLYRMLSREGNPRLSTLGSVLNALGMDLSVKLKQPANEGAPQPTGNLNVITTQGTIPAGFVGQVKTKIPSGYITSSVGRSVQVAVGTAASLSQAA